MSDKEWAIQAVAAMLLRVWSVVDWENARLIAERRRG